MTNRFVRCSIYTKTSQLRHPPPSNNFYENLQKFGYVLSLRLYSGPTAKWLRVCVVAESRIVVQWAAPAGINGGHFKFIDGEGFCTNEH